jgi:hypothetical protein
MVRIFRVLKLGKYVQGLTLFQETLELSAPALGVSRLQMHCVAMSHALMHLVLHLISRRLRIGLHEHYGLRSASLRSASLALSPMALPLLKSAPQYAQCGSHKHKRLARWFVPALRRMIASAVRELFAGHGSNEHGSNIQVLAFVIVIAIVLFSSVMYYAEKDLPLEHHYESIPASMWSSPALASSQACPLHAPCRHGRLVCGNWSGCAFRVRRGPQPHKSRKACRCMI